MKRLILLLVMLILSLTILTACKDDEADSSGTAEDELVCSECGSEDVVPIIYGEPNMELFEAAERGEVCLGGCIIFDDAPNWYCNNCGAQWE